jgi:hypothetical protein
MKITILLLLTHLSFPTSIPIPSPPSHHSLLT